MNLARLSLQTSLLADYDEARIVTSPHFTYPGPFRLLRSRIKLQHYLSSNPETKEGVIDMSQAILDCLNPSLAARREIERTMGGSLVSLYFDSNNPVHLNIGIDLLRGVYNYAVEEGTWDERRKAREDFFPALSLRYQERRRREDLEEMIECTSHVFEGCPDDFGREELRKALYPLLLRRFGDFGEVHALEEAIGIMVQDDPDYATLLESFVNISYSSYKENNDPIDLRKSFENRKLWLRLNETKDSPERGPHLLTLVLQLFEINQLRNTTDQSHNILPLEELNIGITSCREALAIPNLSPGPRLQALIFLSSLLSSRFRITHNPEDINNSVITAEEVLSMTNTDTPQYLTRSDVLLPLLMDRAKTVTVVEAREDMKKALVLTEKLVDICPKDHPKYFVYVGNMGNVHHWCFLYGVEDTQFHIRQSLKYLENAETNLQQS